MTALSAFRPASHRVLPLPIRLLRLAGVVMLLATGLLQAAGKDLPFGEAADPLPPEVAFVPTLSASARDELLVEFTIAPKYYLYRDRIEITTAGGETASLGKADLPTGLKIEDDFFGESWIYRDSVRISVPVTVPPGQNSLALEVVFQGCADMGLCYPPLTQAHEVALPAGPTVAALGADEPADSPAGRFTAQPADQSAAQLAAQSSALPTGKGPGNLRELLDETDTTSDSDELLPPREAFVPRLGPSRTDTLALSWQIEPGYYLYKDKLQFTLEGADGATISAAIGAIDLPDGEQQHDDFFGTTEVYRDATDIQLAVDPPATVRDAELVISYQGCADIGVCFPPDTLRVPVTFNAAAALLPASTTDGFAAERVSEQDRLSGQLASASLWLNALTFFGLGLLLAFTPCVLPMIPILSSLIVGQGERLSTGHAFRLSLVYVLAMALTYTTLGVLVGLSGYNLQAWFQDPWILSAFAALFVLLSLSMFGLYELQVPLAVQNRLAAWSNRQQGGRLGGVAIMGFLSALIVGPCVTAPLVGALVYIAETGDAVIGGVALFSLSMGMGCAIAAGRHLGRPTDAECRCLDGQDQGRVRGDPAGHGDLDALALSARWRDPRTVRHPAGAQRHLLRRHRRSRSAQQRRTAPWQGRWPGGVAVRRGPDDWCPVRWAQLSDPTAGHRQRRRRERRVR